MAIDKNWKVTDDASLFEMLNWKVKIIEGTYSNIKITSPIDLKIAKLFVKEPQLKGFIDTKNAIITI